MATNHISTPTDSDSTVYADNGVRGNYLIPTLRPVDNLIPFATSGAITDLDPQTINEACPVCFNPIYECLCGAQS